MCKWFKITMGIAIASFANWIDAGPSFAESRRTLELKKLRMVSRVALEREVEVEGLVYEN
jgi:hypothetical protein